MSKKIIWINGSPKSDKESCSHKMIQYFSKALEDSYDLSSEYSALKLCLKPTLLDAHFSEVLNADTLVIVSPLYADSMPSSVLDYLHKLECFTKSHPELVTQPLKVYGFINCGFLGGHKNFIALEILENFTSRIHFTWCGGLGVGSGAMLADTLDKIPRKAKIQQPIYEGLDAFTTALKTGTSIASPHHRLLVTQNFSPSLFIFFLNISWMAISGWKFHKIYSKPNLKS